jgi:hypothetical protein
MKSILTTLILLSVVQLHAQSVVLSWDASPSLEIVSYRIYGGTNAGNYLFATNVGLVFKHTVILPHAGRWYFAATALDVYGVESDFSNEVSWEPKPAPPVLHGENWVRLVPVFQRSTNLVDWSAFTGAPTWIAATNAQEFFATDKLQIEQAQRVTEP